MKAIDLLENYDEYCIYKAPEGTHLYSCEISTDKGIFQAYGETRDHAILKAIRNARRKERDGRKG